MISIHEQKQYEKKRQREVEMMLDSPYRHHIYVRVKELLKALKKQEKHKKADVIREYFRAFYLFTLGDKSQLKKAKMLVEYINNNEVYPE